MSNIRLQGPENFGGFSHAGQSYTPDDDGVIEVPAHLPTEVLAAHGLKPAAAKTVKPLAKDADRAPKGDAEGDDDDTKKKPLKKAEDADRAPKGGK